jgi:alpha-beta hydrolase superfamily lysophospholipase
MRSWTSVIADLEHWCDHVVVPARMPTAGPPLNAFAYGQSMGGAVLLDLAMRKPTRFDGLILTAPMVRIADETRPHPVVESVLRHVACRIPILRDMAIVPNDGFVADIFAVDARWRMDEHLERNQLNYSGPTRLITGLTLIDASDGIAARMEALHTPFLVIHGKDDRTTQPQLSEELYRRASAVDKAIELVDGARHGLDFGEMPAVMERSFNVAFSWIRARLPVDGTAPTAKSA